MFTGTQLLISTKLTSFKERPFTKMYYKSLLFIKINVYTYNMPYLTLKLLYF